VNVNIYVDSAVVAGVLANCRRQSANFLRVPNEKYTCKYMNIGRQRLVTNLLPCLQKPGLNFKPELILALV